jgi:hypothetical protein
MRMTLPASLFFLFAASDIVLMDINVDIIALDA